MRKMFSKKQLEEMIKKGNEVIKSGDYIYDNDSESFIHVDEDELPEDFSGVLFSLSGNGISFEVYDEGTAEQYAYYTLDGASKIQPNAVFIDLTHSFGELDETLQALVESAIEAGADGVSCTQAQWSAIKELLDKSLYISYNGYSMIKTSSDGIKIYYFGSSLHTDDMECSLRINYEDLGNKLIVVYTEV